MMLVKPKGLEKQPEATVLHAALIFRGRQSPKWWKKAFCIL